jgi:hypothetical protein
MRGLTMSGRVAGHQPAASYRARMDTYLRRYTHPAMDA